MLRIDAGDKRLSYFAPQEVDRSRLAGRGIRVQRFPRAVEQALFGHIGPLANLRSSSGCILSFETDSPWVVLEFQRLRHHQSAAVGVDCEVYMNKVYMNNAAISDTPWWHLSASPDLRDRDGAVSIRFATGLERGKDCRRVLVHLPLISTAVLAGIKLTRGSQLQTYALPAPRWLAIGDSLTQGFSVQAPCQHWVQRVSRELDLPVWNLGIGGIGIDPEAFAWSLEKHQWDLVTIGLGSNHAWSDQAADSCVSQAHQLLDHIAAAGIDAQRLLWLLPPWKPMEAGLGPHDFMGVALDAAAGARLQRIRADLITVCEQRGLAYIGDLLPEDPAYFVDGLHPAARGMEYYAGRIIDVVKNILPTECSP